MAKINNIIFGLVFLIALVAVPTAVEEMTFTNGMLLIGVVFGSLAIWAKTLKPEKRERSNR